MNYIEHVVILVSTVTRCVSISAFAFFVSIPVGITSSKLNRVEVLISKALIDPDVIHDELFLINNVLKEYDYMKEEIKT